MGQPTGDDELMTIDDLARRLKVKRSWVRDAVTARRIPCTRVGRHVRFSEEDYQAIKAAGQQPVEQPSAGELLALATTFRHSPAA